MYDDGVYPGRGISLPITFGSTISGSITAPGSKQTSVAEISLASHGTPSSRTKHKIKFRARTTSGSTGVLKAALYEGATNRSGDLVSIPLTNTFVLYSLDVSDAAAAAITSYSNLSIKFWGYDSSGAALTFEVAEIYLELPAASGVVTYYGAVGRTFTLARAVAGDISSMQTTVAEISLASHGTPYARTNHSIKVRARTTSGSTGILKAALYEGSTKRSGTVDLATTPLTTSFVDYTLEIPEAEAANIADYSNLSIRFWGHDPTEAGLVFEVSKIYLELPAVTGGTTLYGIVSRITTFIKAVSGLISSKRTSTAQISLASHGTPSSRTQHTIKLRARTTSGSTGVLKVELYEGSTLRSGTSPLVTGQLTNSLANYSLPISDAEAASITDYSNLSVKLWGFDPSGNALVFEVAEIYLELPTA